MHIYIDKYYSDEEVQDLLSRGLAVDGTQGGFVLGPSHDEGGVHILEFAFSGYQLKGEMEGY